ncbi:MAG: precorrin-3B C(17)-methyltransferase [Deltaproteobacteria bacterium]|nr:precorrin-3B C(17)-methyltransferase [Deltaproteobacteria bacterium]
MEKENKIRTHNDSSGKGRLYIVGIGPGGPLHLTQRAKEALKDADLIAGYKRYIGLIAPLIEGKEVFSNGMTEEATRCRFAIDAARTGKKVAVISSGDSGIYGMAGLILELLKGNSDIEVEVIPGVPAFVAASSLLGAPLMHDFASISLSDLLTDWVKIEERVEAAAKADFVIILYNPKSSKRVEGLKKALDIIRRHRGGKTPVGFVRNATREGEEAIATTLGDFDRLFQKTDMLSIIIVGNSSTFIDNNRIITPRGYNI